MSASTSKTNSRAGSSDTIKLAKAADAAGDDGLNTPPPRTSSPAAAANGARSNAEQSAGRSRPRASKEQTVDPKEEEARRKKLNFLLQKSGVYSKIMQQKMDKEREKRLAAEKKKRSEASSSKDVAKSDADSSENAKRGEAGPNGASDARRTTRGGDQHKAAPLPKRTRHDAPRKKEGYELSNYIDEDVVKAAAAAKTDADDAKASKKRKTENGNGVAVKSEGEAQTESAQQEDEDEEDVKGRQPALITGATMRKYQLAGLEWMVSLYENGLNGILADEMGLGKTLQTISFFAYLKSKNVWGPFLVVAPKSTTLNWLREIQKFSPSIPGLCYMGSKEERRVLRSQHLRKPGTVQEKSRFPVVITSYEAAIADRVALAQHDWKFLVVDEGHRIKNMESKLITELKKYRTANRLLLTGTPLHNNLRELWSLLNFILPDIFDDLATFESWFDFDGLHDGESSAFLTQDYRKNVVEQLHAILKPFLLRRTKDDVENLPPKKEYLLYAPLTAEQKQLYDAVTDRTIRRVLLERKTGMSWDEIVKVRPDCRKWASLGKDGKSIQGPLYGNPEDGYAVRSESLSEDEVEETTAVGKRAQREQGSGDRKGRARRAKKNITYDEHRLSDDAWADKIEAESSDEEEVDPIVDPDDVAHQGKLHAIQEARRVINDMKMSNTAMLLRQICCHPYEVDWPKDENGHEIISDGLINASGKMLMLNRLLERLFKGGHKVLIFSQFTKILDIIEDWAQEDKNWNTFRIDGNTSLQDREDQMNAFNNEKGPDAVNLFLLSTRAGGLGINLIAADTVIFYDSDWNPQADLQAQDRAHRIGQTKPVLVLRLVAANTFEQRILRRATAKRQLEKMVMAEDQFRGISLDAMKSIRSGRQNQKYTISDVFMRLEPEKVQLAGKGDQIISDANLEMLLDRSPEAFKRKSGWVTSRQGKTLAGGAQNEDDEAQMAFEVTETDAKQDESEDRELKQLYGDTSKGGYD
ncbi:hypothetical protein IE81DRAFT_345625 [Ceraceosorus guamensis]|uniref:Uncharacterized protein n=1 Tax=Ceraceosorus guamensis TaxID=1522189 RepID=A0A316W6L3_9BASI|nr:hypothetical protein IE81DRAFT_345625 [Ceraceosorus guamensis]PWN44391.1 hypothetical protein IE81DRAFT_345625 [Ceraceosorus guamensis]